MRAGWSSRAKGAQPMLQASCISTAHRLVVSPRCSRPGAADVGELVGEAGPGGHFQEQFGQLDPRQQGRQTVAKLYQARRLFQRIEGGDAQPVPTVDGLDRSRRIVARWSAVWR